MSAPGVDEDPPQIPDLSAVRVQGPKAGVFYMAASVRWEHISAVDVDRSKWLAAVTHKYPLLTELRQRLYSLERAIAFGAIYGGGDPRIASGLGRRIILQLIMQFMLHYELTASLRTLQDEAHIQFVDHGIKGECRLMTILHTAVQRVDRLWELTLMDPKKVPPDVSMKIVQQYVVNGLHLHEADLSDSRIWTEPPECELNAVVDMEGEFSGQLKAATFNVLVRRLTSRGSGGRFSKSFLLTYLSFATPDQLLSKLIDRFHVPREMPEIQSSSEEGKMWVQTRKNIPLLVIKIMRMWIEQFWYDYTDELVASVHAFIASIAQDYQSFAELLSKSLAKRLAPATDAHRRRVFDTEAPEPRVPKTIFMPTLQLFDCDEEEIARQITITEFRMYMAIQPPELLAQAWSKPRLHHRARNVLRIIEQFNRLSRWAATIIAEPTRLRDRARALARLLTIADHLRRQNNFSGLMALLSGMNNAAIHRLRFTREEIPQSKQRLWTELQALTSTQRNMHALRSALRGAQPPVIPYLGIYLTDLTFIGDGNKDTITVTPKGKDGLPLGPSRRLIHFRKRMYEANVILEIQQYQQTPYNLEYVHQIARLLDTLEGRSDKELYEMSLVREPRGAGFADIEY